MFISTKKLLWIYLFFPDFQRVSGNGTEPLTFGDTAQVENSVIFRGTQSSCNLPTGLGNIKKSLTTPRKPLPFAAGNRTCAELARKQPLEKELQQPSPGMKVQGLYPAKMSHLVLLQRSEETLSLIGSLFKSQLFPLGKGKS